MGYGCIRTYIYRMFLMPNTVRKDMSPYDYMTKFTCVNMGHAQVIGIVLCWFPNCSIIYLVWPVYYCPGHPSNTISSGDLKFYVGFQKLLLNLLNIVTLLTLKVILVDHPTRLKTILSIFKCKLSKSTLAKIIIFLSQLSVHFQNKISISLFIIVLVVSLLS